MTLCHCDCERSIDTMSPECDGRPRSSRINACHIMLPPMYRPIFHPSRMTLAASARQLGVHTETLRQWHRSGVVPGTYDRTNGRWRFDREHLNNFIRERGLQLHSGVFMEDRPYTPPKLARELGISARRVRGMIERNEIAVVPLPPGRTGRKTLWITRAEAERVKAKLQQAAPVRSRKKTKVPA